MPIVKQLSWLRAVVIIMLAIAFTWLFCTSSRSAAKENCAAHLRKVFLDGDLSDGIGLPEKCLLAEANAAFGNVYTNGSGRRGAFRKYRVNQQEHEIRVFFYDNRINLVDLGYPKLRQKSDAILTALGKPSAKLIAHMEWLEYVYLDRGITIAFDGHQIDHLFLYTPTTMDDYVGRLGGKDKWVRRFPRNR